MKSFAELSEQEILALAISNEDEDSRIYRGFAEGLREPFPASAKVFDEMADEEVRHRTMLFDMYREKFGDWPQHGGVTPIKPSPEVLSWVRSRNIAWAKSNQRAAQ